MPNVDDYAMWLKDEWPLDRFEGWSREYGPVRHTVSPVARETPVLFTFWSSSDTEFPSFVKSTISRRYFAFASCVQCGAMMGVFQTRIIKRVGDQRLYFACECGHPIWQMCYRHFEVALNVMEDSAKRYRRKHLLAEAGGRHYEKDIAEILVKQKRRCIYCNRLFGAYLAPTRDHLLALTHGGGDWPLNIVLACRSCNSSRCNLPFRTYVRMLSPTQNKRILAHLVRRLSDLKDDAATRQGLDCFDFALRLNDTKSLRFKMMKHKPAARRNLMLNKLFPNSAIGVQKAYISVLKREIERNSTSPTSQPSLS
ncbi:HNH endonuclease [Terriglobus roseus]|uniref:HNH endonuclease n=1 Tax=Terriglobus roseus TaxID=392734 RepID=A0A1G7HPI1_9BACT|nr:HNH endonuclease signature motif containing protein [Terriglobus roseus]SDF01899.1 HNH endonuclease [Terriglobus roseus]